MSARMPSIPPAPGKGSLEVHEWLERVNDGADIDALEPSPLATVCSSAVDPLEIAVALEVAGISHAVATERYNRADVFALARTLWQHVPMRTAPGKPVELPRSGDRRDLGRGVLYALPAVMLLALTVAFDFQLTRWVLPVAISWGWGLGQVAAFIGYRVQDADPSHEAAVILRFAGAAVLATVVVSAIGAVIGGGSVGAAIAATALVTYIVASAILLVRSEERWLAWLLLPGAVGSMFVLLFSRESLLSRVLVVTLVGASFVAVISRALVRSRPNVKADEKRFERRDLLIGLGHLLHGVICGLAVSLVVIQVGRRGSDSSFGRMLLPIPLLGSLGVMEWQLHTFRHRIAELTQSLQHVREFPIRAWRVFLRALSICTAALIIGATAVVVAVWIHGGDAPVATLALQCGLGAVFFCDLILMLLDRLDIDLRSWLVGLVGGSAALAIAVMVSGGITATTALIAGATLVAIVLISLLLSIRKVVTAAMNH